MGRIVVYETKICLICGQEYPPASSGQKYCPVCRPEADRRQATKDNKKRYDAHPKEWNARARAFYAAHLPEMVSYRLDHRDKRAEQNREWRQANPDKRRLNEEKRRALKYANTPIEEMLTEIQWHDILDEYHHRCAYCGKKLDKLTIDHVVPLSRGGKHSVSNVVPACRHCNNVKYAKTPEQWVGMKVTNG